MDELVKAFRELSVILEDEVNKAFFELGKAAKEYTEQVEANLIRYKEWMHHRNNNNWLRMHGYSMVSRKRYQHERKRPYWKRDGRRKAAT